MKKSEGKDATESKFKSILITCFETIRKSSSGKRDKNLSSDIQTALDNLKGNNETEHNANKYFPLFKRGIELQNKRVTEAILRSTMVNLK